MTPPARLTWVVLVRVPKDDWVAYGPFTHRKAIEFAHKSAGTGIERKCVPLIKPKEEAPA